MSRRGSYYTGIDGLKAGLKEFGFEEGKQYMIEAHDVNDTNAVCCDTLYSIFAILRK